jgi:CheY-like chemotaxis protein
MPDLMLLDVMMPGMTGPELWEAIRSREATGHSGDLHDREGRSRISADLMERGALRS